MAIYPDDTTEAETAIRSQLNESVAGFFTSTQIQNWIKQAVSDISVRCNGVPGDGYITIVAATLHYTATSGTVVQVSDMVKVFSASYYNGTSYRGLEELTPAQFLGHMANEALGEPKYWTKVGDSIGIFPLSSAGLAGNRIYIYFAQTTATLATLINELKPGVVPYVAAQASAKRRNWEAAAKFRQAYKDFIQEYLKSSSTQLTGSPREAPEVAQ